MKEVKPIKKAWILVHLLLLTLAAYLGTNLIYAPFKSNSDAVRRPSGSTQPDALRIDQDAAAVPDQEKMKVILSRNLFHVLPFPEIKSDNGDSDTPEIGHLKPTRLDLALWGTVTGSKTTPDWAVIEDRKEKAQALYQVGDAVAGATIKKILRNKIILRYQNQDQILEVDPSLAPPGTPVSPGIQTPPSLFPNGMISTGTLSGAFPDLMKQVRIRPFFRQGDPQGMLLYGIKPDSSFYRMGLKNGDIVQEINGSPTLNAADAKSVYQSAASREETRMVLLRRGKKIELVYTPQDNTHTTQAVSNE